MPAQLLKFGSAWRACAAARRLHCIVRSTGAVARTGLATVPHHFSQTWCTARFIAIRSAGSSSFSSWMSPHTKSSPAPRPTCTAISRASLMFSAKPSTPSPRGCGQRRAKARRYQPFPQPRSTAKPPRASAAARTSRFCRQGAPTLFAYHQIARHNRVGRRRDVEIVDRSKTLGSAFRRTRHSHLFG